MISQTKRALVALALCSACADADTEDALDSSTPNYTATDAAVVAFSDSALAANPSPQADAGALPLNPVVMDAGTNPNPGFMLPVLPTRDAGGATTDAAAPVVPTPDTVCSGSPTGMAGSTANVTLDGRNYTLHIGRSVVPSKAAPLVFSLHGLNMTPALMESMAGWDPIADREGIIIARPAGVGSSNGWDLSSNKDFDLMKAIIEDVNKKACVDRKRIFATGFSHGGFMSFAIACKLGDVFAAVAPNAGAGSAARGCGARAVPVYAFHGDADGIVSYSSGKSAVDSWVKKDMCTGTPTDFKVGSANCQDWNMCAAGSEVKFCTIPGGGHSYMRGATQPIWEFFKAHPLP